MSLQAFTRNEERRTAVATAALVVLLFGIELVRIMKESHMAEQEPKKGQMTVEEAGRKGGETVRDERGSEFYSEIGHKGGQRVRELIEEGKQSEEDQRGGSKG